jgi:hypothetical protein
MKYNIDRSIYSKVTFGDDLLISKRASSLDSSFSSKEMVSGDFWVRRLCFTEGYGLFYRGMRRVAGSL